MLDSVNSKQVFVLDGRRAQKEQLLVKHEIILKNHMLYESIIMHIFWSFEHMKWIVFKGEYVFLIFHKKFGKYKITMLWN